MTKSIAIGVVCLFLVNDAAFGLPSQYSENSRDALAPYLFTKSPHDGWTLAELGFIMGQMLIDTERLKLTHPIELLIPVMKGHVRNMTGESGLLEESSIDGIEEVWEDNKITGFAMTVISDGMKTHRLVFNLSGGDEVAELKDGTKVYVKEDEKINIVRTIHLNDYNNACAELISANGLVRMAIELIDSGAASEFGRAKTSIEEAIRQYRRIFHRRFIDKGLSYAIAQNHLFAQGLLMSLDGDGQKAIYANIDKARNLSRQLNIGPGSNVVSVGPGPEYALLTSDGEHFNVPSIVWEQLCLSVGASIAVYEPNPEDNAGWQKFASNWRGNGAIEAMPLEKSSFETCDLDDGSVDVIVIACVLSDPKITDVVKREIALVAAKKLRPGGYLIVGAYYRYDDKEWGPTDIALQSLRDAGYSIEMKKSIADTVVVSTPLSREWRCYQVSPPSGKGIRDGSGAELTSVSTSIPDMSPRDTPLMTNKRIDKAQSSKPPRKPAPGSIAGVFGYLCDKDIIEKSGGKAGQQIADGVGRKFPTIYTDLRALFYHMRLIDVSREFRGKAGDVNRFYVPEDIKNKKKWLMLILERFTGTDTEGNSLLRPDVATLDRVYEEEIRPIIELPEYAWDTLAALKAASGNYSEAARTLANLPQHVFYKRMRIIRDYAERTQNAMVLSQLREIQKLKKKVSNARRHKREKGANAGPSMPSYKDQLLEALDKSGGYQNKAARRLGISDAGLSRRIKTIRKIAGETGDTITLSELDRVLKRPVAGKKIRPIIDMPGYTEETLAALRAASGNKNKAAKALTNLSRQGMGERLRLIEEAAKRTHNTTVLLKLRRLRTVRRKAIERSRMRRSDMRLPQSEEAHKTALQDLIKYIEAEQQAVPPIVALGTNWIKGYVRGEYQQYDAINPLIISIRKYCESKGIPFIDDDDNKLSDRIETERKKKGMSGAKVIVLAGKNAVSSDDFNALRSDEKNVIVGVDNKELTPESYIRLMEMLTIAFKFSLGFDVDQASTTIKIMKDEKLHIIIFTPPAQPMPYEDQRRIYEVQKFA